MNSTIYIYGWVSNMHEDAFAWLKKFLIGFIYLIIFLSRLPQPSIGIFLQLSL